MAVVDKRTKTTKIDNIRTLSELANTLPSKTDASCSHTNLPTLNTKTRFSLRLFGRMYTMWTVNGQVGHRSPQISQTLKEWRLMAIRRRIGRLKTIGSRGILFVRSMKLTENCLKLTVGARYMIDSLSIVDKNVQDVQILLYKGPHSSTRPVGNAYRGKGGEIGDGGY
ncbi:hypothetical protein CPC08DRAFT_724682 [Agrocybe pediades]|nr:hypothetical protein CPC08DRAFT_724682 [Agrocybe pediades]